MPLLNGSDPTIISQNIRELRHSGKPEDQSVAIAYSVAGKSKKKGHPNRAKNLGAYHHKPKGDKEIID